MVVSWDVIGYVFGSVHSNAFNCVEKICGGMGMSPSDIRERFVFVKMLQSLQDLLDCQRRTDLLQRYSGNYRGISVIHSTGSSGDIGTGTDSHNDMIVGGRRGGDHTGEAGTTMIENVG